MTDRESLLAAVVADPDNPLPRLVFADFLDETGDPEWAELIRLQNGYFKHWTNAEEMQEREAELVEVVRARYPDRETGVEFSLPKRGFPEVIYLNHEASEFDPTFAASILATYPVTWFMLYDEIPEFLIAEGWLRRARVIELSRFTVRYSVNRQFPPLFLETLDPAILRAWFWQNQSYVGDDEAELLATIPQLAGLRELCLSNNDVGPAGCDALIRSPHLTQLQYLDLAGNPVGDAAERLERRFGSALRLV
jgi:uncharacterized protein (TIGR02996 family)